MKHVSIIVASIVLVSACAGGSAAPDAGVEGGADPACSSPAPAPTCAGVTAPAWKLEDFQPRSPGYKDRYGPAEMRGKPLLVTMQSAWCPYCQAQVGRLEALRKELLAAGKSVQIVGVNSSDQRAVDAQQELVSRTDIPLFQDTTKANGSSFDTAYQLHGGRKDDIYLYDSQGVLLSFFRNGGPVKIDLTTPEGYKNIKDALLAAK